MTSNILKVSLIFSSLIIAFMAPQVTAMDPEIKETFTFTKKHSSVTNKTNTSSFMFGDQRSKHDFKDQDIFNKLNTSLSFLLTTQEVMSTFLKDLANYDGSFTLRAKVDKSKPFWRQLINLDPTMYSFNALRLVCYMIRKHNQLYELAAMNMEVLQSIHKDPCDNPYYFSLQLSSSLINFAQEDTNIIKNFVSILMNAHKDPEISQIIENRAVFNALIQDLSLVDIIGMKDLRPLRLVNSQGARYGQILQMYGQIQEEIDNILIFKNLIFPGGRVTSYHHNQAAQVRKYCQDSLNALQVKADYLNKMMPWIDDDDRADHILKFWTDYRSVLLENYQAILDASPADLILPKSVSMKTINRVYDAQTAKINAHRLNNSVFKKTAENISYQLIIDALSPDGTLSASQRISTRACYNYVSKLLDGKKYSIQDLFTTLEKTLSILLVERKELGLLPESFFLEPLFQEFKKSLCLPVNESDSSNLLAMVKAFEEEVILPPFSPKKTPQKSLKKKKKNKRTQQQVQRPNAHEKNDASQNALVQVSAPLSTQPGHHVNKKNEEAEPITTSVPQIAIPQKIVPQIIVEETPTVTPPPIEIEKQVEFGADYFRVLHAHYQKLKNSQKNQPEGGANPPLALYELELYTYLRDSVFNNNNRPSWNGIVQDLGVLGFLGKPNTVGNGSTWVFSVTPKNGLFFADENYRYVTFNVHCIHGKKGNEPLPIPYLKFFQSGFSHMFGLTKEVVEECLRQHNFR